MPLPHDDVRWGTSQCQQTRSVRRGGHIVMVLTTSRQGRLSARTGGNRFRSYVLTHSVFAGIGSVQNVVPVFHIACRITANLRATATTAFLCPFRALSISPQLLSAVAVRERANT